MVCKCFCLGMMVVAAITSVKGTAEVMSHVTAHFGKALDECREEAGLSTDVLDEFKNFWSEDFEVVHRELGCALICMSNKLSLLHDDTRVHRVNMLDYIKNFPNGEVLSEKMVTLIKNCEKQFDNIKDDCDRTVKVAACFKADAKKEGIAPEVAMVETVIELY
ncbi:unnamed protein product [Diatraea saccharalis]|uniref:General odorant-binding protein 2 n=1 Tax=Diatraea saccharalis TaxID=40085 RepID=A0A9P0CDL8_9NEOP|nr:unnamed protein product [Diatraea saccharalis]